MMKKQGRLSKKTILKVLEKHNLHHDRIILFGSRARGDQTKDSDWDILLIIKGEIDREEERILFKEITKMLAKYLIPCDLLIRTIQEVDMFKNYVCSVTKTALKEGISL